jgi:hypothetical protein
MSSPVTRAVQRSQATEGALPIAQVDHLGVVRLNEHAPNGTIWNLATHAADPDFLLASSVNGEVFCSTDAGDFLEQVCQGIWRGARPHLGAELALGHSARGRTPRLHPRQRNFGLRQSPYARRQSAASTLSNSGEYIYPPGRCYA